MYRRSNNPIFKTNVASTIVLVLLLLPLLNGCATTNSDNDSSLNATQPESKVSRENYTRILQQGQIIGYIGSKSVTVTDGGSQTTTVLNNIYDPGFKILGSYDGAGSTHRYAKEGPVKLGHFTAEQSFRQITGVEGILEFQEGLQ